LIPGATVTTAEIEEELIEELEGHHRHRATANSITTDDVRLVEIRGNPRTAHLPNQELLLRVIGLAIALSIEGEVHDRPLEIRGTRCVNATEDESCWTQEDPKSQNEASHTTHLHQ